MLIWKKKISSRNWFINLAKKQNHADKNTYIFFFPIVLATAWVEVQDFESRAAS